MAPAGSRYVEGFGWMDPDHYAAYGDYLERQRLMNHMRRAVDHYGIGTAAPSSSYTSQMAEQVKRRWDGIFAQGDMARGDMARHVSQTEYDQRTTAWRMKASEITRETEQRARKQLLMEQAMALQGTKFTIVVPGRQFDEADTVEQAKSKAEALAHQFQCDVFILKPAFKIAPKRDTVTTEL